MRKIVKLAQQNNLAGQERLTYFNQLNKYEKRVYETLLVMKPMIALRYIVDTVKFRDEKPDVSWDVYTLNIMSGALTFGDKATKLRPIETKVLEFVLVKQGRGEVAKIFDISAHVYADNFSVDNLRPHLTWLKQKIPMLRTEVSDDTTSRKLLILEKPTL